MNYRQILIATIQTVGLFVAGFVIPLLGQVVALFTPVPLILVYVRNGKREGFISLIASSVIIGVIGGWQLAVILLFSFGLMAIGISEGMRRQWKPESCALAGGLLPLIVLAIVTALYVFKSGKNPVLALDDYLRESIAEAARFYTQLGLAEMANVISSISDTFVYYFVRLIPGIMIATSVFQAACCYGLSRALILRRPGASPALTNTSLAAWHAPDVWVWGLIIALALIMVPGEPAKFTGWNLAILYALLYLVQGIAIVEHYLRKGRIRPYIRGLIHTLILALPSIVFVIALGIVDIWADFRKVRGPVKA